MNLRLFTARVFAPSDSKARTDPSCKGIKRTSGLGNKGTAELTLRCSGRHNLLSTPPCRCKLRAAGQLPLQSQAPAAVPALRMRRGAAAWMRCGQSSSWRARGRASRPVPRSTESPAHCRWQPRRACGNKVKQADAPAVSIGLWHLAPMPLQKTPSQQAYCSLFTTANAHCGDAQSIREGRRGGALAHCLLLSFLLPSARHGMGGTT